MSVTKVEMYKEDCPCLSLEWMEHDFNVWAFEHSDSERGKKWHCKVSKDDLDVYDFWCDTLSYIAVNIRKVVKALTMEDL